MDLNIKVVKGDITSVRCDAIVNAANSTLLGGGGVDGAIHRAAGPGLLDECRTLNGCQVGEAKITGAYNLPARFVIHTVGPVWVGGHRDEHILLASSYKNTLKLAAGHKCKSIAFPNISTGAYRFPEDQAAMIAIREVKRFLNRTEEPPEIIFVTYTETNYKLYKDLLEHGGDAE